MENENIFVEKTIRIIAPMKIANRPLELLKDKFRTERQANGSDLLVIYEEKQRPEYERVIIQPSNPDMREKIEQQINVLKNIPEEVKNAFINKEK